MFDPILDVLDAVGDYTNHFDDRIKAKSVLDGSKNLSLFSYCI